jgi:hypothetical protein
MPAQFVGERTTPKLNRKYNLPLTELTRPLPPRKWNVFAPHTSGDGYAYCPLLVGSSASSEGAEEGRAIAEVYVWLCSQIGQPIDAPQVAAVPVLLQEGACLAEVAPSVQARCRAGRCAREIAGVHVFTERLARGELPMC